MSARWFRPCPWLVAAALALPSVPVRAAEYRQEQGPASAVLAAGKVEGGTAEIRLSDQVEVTLRLVARAPLEVEPIRVVTASKGWAVKKASEARTDPVAPGKAEWRQTFTLDPRDKGDLPLQLAPLRYREAGGAWQTITWQPIPVRVTTDVAVVDPSQARDITDIEELPPPASYRWLLWAGVGIAALGLLLGAWELRRRHVGPAPPLEPGRWAMQELARIDALGLPEAGEAERYHTLLSDVVRRFIEARYHLRAPQQTTVEFLEAMRQAPQLTSEQQGLLRDFLERSDLAKFARAEFSPQDCRASAQMARAFVEQSAA